MSIAAALAAHAHLAPSRPSPPSSPSLALPTIVEAPQEAAVDVDCTSTPSTPSLTSSRNSSFDSQSFPASPASINPPLSESISCGSNIRRNEHLAVLISKDLWKPDSQSSYCDMFVCRRKFTLFERKHHCRKCGGVFCGQCSSRVTQLLDTNNLDFLLPPRNVSISQYESPISPVLTVRVCDDCYVQIHGADDVDSAASSASSSIRRMGEITSSSSLASSGLGGKRVRHRTTGRRARRSRSQNSSDVSSLPPSTPSQPSPESSLGDLDYYPLRHHSSICRATGGGRWEPKPVRNWDGHRIPGGKAPFEIAMEREAEKERLRRLNPIIRHGEFQLRAPRPPEPIEYRKSFDEATF